MFYFIDLDGTILDVSKKYRFVYEEVLAINQSESLEIWNLRRAGYRLEQILEMYIPGKRKRDKAREHWNFLIEDSESLDRDLILPGVLNFLQYLKHNKVNLILFTGRRNQANLMKQLINWNLENSFDDILMDSESLGKHVLFQRFVQRNQSTSPMRDYIVSDSPEDLLIAQNHQKRSCGVLSGVSNLKSFGEMKEPPTLLLQSLEDWANHKTLWL
jgi:phosphoglycolate phosphatase-like HAD superfamily hydrolase